MKKYMESKLNAFSIMDSLSYMLKEWGDKSTEVQYLFSGQLSHSFTVGEPGICLGALNYEELNVLFGYMHL